MTYETPTGNYKVSAPATAAAHTLWLNLNFQDRGKVAATQQNVAILIDLFTQLFRVEMALDQLVRTVQWLDREELASNMAKAQEALRALEIVRQRMPAFDRDTKGPSAPATNAARALLENFVITHKPHSRIRKPPDDRPVPTERNLARAIDVTAGIFRIEETVDVQVSQILRMDRTTLPQHLEMLRNTVRAVELVRNRLPNYEKAPAFTRRFPKTEPPKLTQEQKRYLGHVSTALKNATTVQEHQEVLQKAGLVPA